MEIRLAKSKYGMDIWEELNSTLYGDEFMILFRECKNDFLASPEGERYKKFKTEEKAIKYLTTFMN